MASIAVLSTKARGARAMTVVWLTIGLALLIASATSFYLSSRNDALAAYNAAPACAAFADAVAGKDCRYTTTANVTQVDGYNGTEDVFFDIPGQYSPPFFRATLAASDTQWIPGEAVQVEFWESKVTRFGGTITADNPVADPRPGTLLVIGIVLLALGLGALAWGIVSVRRAQSMPAPTMSPLAMSDVLWR